MLSRSLKLGTCCPAAVALTLALGASGCTPAISPSPPPPAPAPAAERPSAPVPPGFSYGAGEEGYVIRTWATVEVRTPDSVSRDTSSRTTWLRVMIGEGTGSRAMEVMVDSVSAAGGRVAAAGGVVGPVRFMGTVENGRIDLPIAPEVSVDCDSPAGTLYTSVLDAFPSFPSRLLPNTRWEETSRSATCRGGIHLTTEARHRYVVLGKALDPALPEAVRIQRTTELRLSGQGTQSGVEVAAEGSGEGSAELTLDVARGWLLRLQGRTRLDLSFSALGRTQQVTQEAEQLVVLVPR